MQRDLARHAERMHEALAWLVEVGAAELDARAQVVGERAAARELAVALRRVVMRTFVRACAEARGMSVGGEAWPSEGLGWSLEPATMRALHERVAGALELASVPASAIGMLYETLLDHELRRSEGRWQLARWAGTRKGAGTFYTPLELAEPTIRRTLQPLTHERVAGAWRVRTPAAIVALRVCDPAIGSGAFAIAALRWLSAALLDALHVHGGERIEPCRAAGQIATTCLRGVDLDPLAVELARLALWLEAGDPTLPPNALDHALRCGNSLIGGSPTRLAAYPFEAWPLRSRRRELERMTWVQPAPTRAAFDAWCALWCWPADALALAPTPASLHAPTPEALVHVHALAAEHGFFHWSLEFPDVFRAGGFDAIIGNPPWDIQKPNSKEFFSSLDPSYRTLDKQAALARQAELFEQAPEREREWLDHQARFKALAQWCAHAFAHQGSADVNTYKLFVELGHGLLRPGGRLGLIVPSGIYSDKGTTALRRLLLDGCAWEWCFGFENHAGIFAIDGRFKFAAIVAQKGGRTQVLQAAFMRRSLAAWAAEPPSAITYSRDHITTFSPSSDALIELESERDLALLAKLYASGHTLGGSSAWGIEYAREFDMTNDSGLFVPWSTLAREGYVTDEYGHALAGAWRAWRGDPDILARAPELVLSRDHTRVISLDAITDVMLPLYQGIMIHQHDFAAKGREGNAWVSLAWPDKAILPQYWLARSHRRSIHELALGFRDIARTTDQRTMVAALLPGMPAGNKVPLLRSRTGLEPELAAVLNSFAFDWMQRIRQASSTLNHHVIADAPLPDPARLHARVGELAMRLGTAHLAFARTHLRRRPERPTRAWRSDWALAPAERLRLRVVLDVLVAAAYGLDADDLAHVLRECDDAKPSARMHPPKGFWRVDKELPPHERLPARVLAAFRELDALGPDALIGRCVGEPERAGDDELDASWAACARHAAQLERLGYSQ